MKKSKLHLKYEQEAIELINKIPAEKMGRALILIEYMAKSSIEEGKMLAEYSKRDEVTLDMMVEWVKNKQNHNKDQSLLVGVV